MIKYEMTFYFSYMRRVHQKHSLKICHHLIIVLVKIDDSKFIEMGIIDNHKPNTLLLRKHSNDDKKYNDEVRPFILSTCAAS